MIISIPEEDLQGKVEVDPLRKLTPDGLPSKVENICHYSGRGKVEERKNSNIIILYSYFNLL